MVSQYRYSITYCTSSLFILFWNGSTVGQFKLLDEDIRRKEVVLALGGLKRNVASGRDGLRAEIVSCDILVDLFGVLLTAAGRSE